MDHEVILVLPFLFQYVVTSTKMIVNSHGTCLLYDVISKDSSYDSWLVNHMMWSPSQDGSKAHGLFSAPGEFMVKLKLVHCSVRVLDPG